MNVRRALSLALFFAVVVTGCSVAPTASATASVDSGVSINCGPIADRRLCEKAVAVAATAKINPPPMVAATLRRPDPSDECTTWFHACGPEALVAIQSGDTIQNVPLLRTADGWVRLDLVR